MTLRELIETIGDLICFAWGMIVLWVKMAIQYLLDAPLTTSVPIMVAVIGALIAWWNFGRIEPPRPEETKEAKMEREDRWVGIGCGAVLMLIGAACWYMCR